VADFDEWEGFLPLPLPGWVPLPLKLQISCSKGEEEERLGKTKLSSAKFII